MFIGREKELQVLKERYDSPKLELGIIYGARRIGKTYLINHSLEGRRHISFLASDTTEKDNRSLFSQKLNEFLGLPSDYIYPTFKQILDVIVEQAKKQSLVLFIDELPFLAKTYPQIINLIQGVINDNQEVNLKIILSGSDYSFMEEILKDKSKPLYQRATFQIKLEQFSFSEAVQMLNGLDNETIINALSVFGPHPFYLSMIDKNKSFEENIKALLFSKFGTLINAPYLTLPLSWGNSGVYTTIYQAISHRINKLSDIASHIGLLPNQLSTYLTKLSNSEILEKKEMFNAGQKNNYYDIKDRLLKFYYNFVYPHLSSISEGLGESVYEAEKNNINLFISKSFENVVIDYLSEQNILRKLDSIYEPFKSLNVDNSKLGRSIQIDAISKSIIDENKLIVVEAKYREKNTSLDVLDHLIESASIFPHYKNKQYYIFSKTGFSDDLLSVNGDNIHLIKLSDMFINSK